MPSINVQSLRSRFFASGGTALQDNQQLRRLEPGKPIERELAGGQSHSYQLSLEAGQYAKLEVDQHGIDVVIRLLGQDGKQIAEFDSESRLQGQESVSLVAEEAGSYRLITQPRYMRTPAGRYVIRVVELRAATDDERALQEARKLVEEHVKLRRGGKYDEALTTAERVLDVREKVLGPDHRDVAASLINLATLHRDKGEYGKAEPLFHRGLTTLEKSVGPGHPDVARALNNLAILYRFTDDYAKAEQFYIRALDVMEKALGSEHHDIAATLNNLAILYASRSNFAKAEQLYLRALAIKENALGPEHLDLAPGLSNLADCHQNKGDYAMAEQLLRRSLAIVEKSLGSEHYYVTFPLCNLAILYRNRGDYAKAEQSYHRALTIMEKTLGQEHHEIGDLLNNLAILYRLRGDYAKAEEFYRRAQGVFEKTLSPEHSTVARSLNNLANLYYDKGDDSKAEQFYNRALAIFEKALGLEHLNVAYPLNNLANLHRNRGEYAKAERFYRRALAIREKASGLESPDVIESLNGLAMLYVAKGEIAQALTFLSRANAARERNLALNLAVGSERQKLIYLALFSKETDFTLSLHSQAAPANSQALDLAFTTLLRRKGRGLDAMANAIATLRRRASPQDQAVFDQLADARAHLAARTLKESGAATPDTYMARLKPLEEKVERLEAELSARSVEFRAQTQPVTVAAIQAALPADGALIEFAVYRPIHPRTEKAKPPRYIAYLLAPQGQPKWVDLGEAVAINLAVDVWRKSLRNPNRTDVKRIARAVDDKVMRPLRPLLGNTRRLLIAPDGSLNLIPFAALVDEQNRYLIERYAISYLTSGRDLLRLQISRPSGNALMVVANPAFGRASTVVAQQKSAELPPGDQARTQGDPAQTYFQPLPSTGREALAIKAVLPEASLLMREQATESAVKQARAPRILHVATHGFFLSDQEAPLAETRGGFGDDPMRASDPRFAKWAARIENPLLRSGLALTGANQGKREEDDGLLTALEVAGLDLWGTKLVILSACDTGVGEVRNGEGVQGLRRALILAGSDSQVMTLWPVLDITTKDLMIPYYKALRQGKGRSDGLRQAQLQMLRGKDSRHPFYWAAFIQSGEWANLDGQR
jgi:CHAT domain-containing protein/tetratricopeptide (TPR) repeat protein